MTSLNPNKGIELTAYPVITERTVATFEIKSGWTLEIVRTLFGEGGKKTELRARIRDGASSARFEYLTGQQLAYLAEAAHLAQHLIDVGNGDSSDEDED